MIANSNLDFAIHSVDSKQRAAIDPGKLADILQMSKAELARLGQVNRTTLTRNPTSPKVQIKLGLIVSILSRATNMSGSLDKASVWFRRQPIPAFGSKRAAELVADGKANDILEWLEAVEDGAYGFWPGRAASIHAEIGSGWNCDLGRNRISNSTTIAAANRRPKVAARSIRRLSRRCSESGVCAEGPRTAGIERRGGRS